MYNCIFTAHCTESFCDKSCPILVETSYLLERNGISMNSSVFSDTSVDIDRMTKVLEKSNNKIGALVVPPGKTNWTTVQSAELLTYCAICHNWQGSRLHCNVYNLKYSKYLDELKKSWNGKGEPEELEYMRIWSETSKVLIISNLDYVNFGDFESQTLLNLLQTRQTGNQTTILVVPPLKSLVSSRNNSLFFTALKARLSDAVKVVSG